MCCRNSINRYTLVCFYGITCFIRQNGIQCIYTRTVECQLSAVICKCSVSTFKIITHTDTPITVTAAFENSDNDVTWCITKDGGEEKLYINYCTGSLRKAGGQISFKTSGIYRLIAGTTDNAGQIHKFSTDIRVYPKPNLTTSLSSFHSIL